MAMEGGEGGGGGRVAVLMSGTLSNAVETEAKTSSASGCDGEQNAPILLLLFFHRAIRTELEALHRLALEFAFGQLADIRPLAERYRFLRLIYKHHCNAEDEVIFPALDLRVKNVAQTYSLEHKGESDLFDHLFELFNYCGKGNETFPRELASCTGALHTSVSQHMSKEEEQVFPLLTEKFSAEEQSSLVWQFLCSIPVDIIKKFLPWLSFCISPDEYQNMCHLLHKIVPKEKLLQQAISKWLDSRDTLDTSGLCLKTTCSLDSHDDNLNQQDENVNQLRSGKMCTCVSSRTAKRKYTVTMNAAADLGIAHPINQIVHWHNAIRKELNEIADQAKKIELSANFSDFSEFYGRLQFIADVCIFHSVAEDKVIFPAVDGSVSLFHEHAKVESQFKELQCLIENFQGAELNSASAACFFTKLCAHADLICQTVDRHFHNEEVEVLPLARKHFTFERQRELLYQSLDLMPLKLIEHVLPWLVGTLTEDEARNFLMNMLLAAPVTDAALVTLYSGWACKGRSFGACLSSSVTGCCPVKQVSGIEENCLLGSCPCTPQESNDEGRAVKRTHPKLCIEGLVSSSSGEAPSEEQSCCVPGLGVNGSHYGLNTVSTPKSFRSLSFGTSAPTLNSSLFIWEMDNSSSNPERAVHPIDTIFKFHKAIRKDLEYLDVESGRLTGCDGALLRQFIGRFRLLWGLYRAHSNAEDAIVFPALESKETLHNVSHSYTLDHKHEEELFVEISHALSDLSKLHDALTGSGKMKDVDLDSFDGPCNGEDVAAKYNELATKVQSMCKSVRVSLQQHIYREELELWPLFDKHFGLEEQEKIVGRIIGTTGAEVLQSILPWLTSALTQDEQNNMMDTLKQATRNTMFSEWLKQCLRRAPELSEQPEASETSNSGRGIGPHESLGLQDQMFKPGWKDIFRMNQTELESEIRKVYRDSTLDPRRKAYLVQNLMTSRWIAYQQKSQASTDETSRSEDVNGHEPSFRDPQKQVYGCKHYKRNCKLRASCCGKLFSCRFCHDEVSDHSMDRKATLEMMCMRCLVVQPIGPVCKTPACNGFPMAKYYCNICKFFDDERNVYHCPSCNLCRLGKGLGIDFYHCMKCNCCLAMKLEDHKCLEKALETNCPICCEFLFTSSASVRPLPCGHYMHSACFQAYACSNYVCPVCSKSMGDMAVYFGMLDALLANEVLPEEYKDRQQDILCNDCRHKGTARFHWLYHKCGFCRSYNTRVIKDISASPDCPGARH